MKCQIKIAAALLLPLLFSCASADAPSDAAGSGLEFVEAESYEDISSGSSAIEIRTNVAKAGIFINGEYQGLSPLALRGLLPGEYRLGVRKGGFSEYTAWILVERGKFLRFFIRLEPEEGGGDLQ